MSTQDDNDRAAGLWTLAIVAVVLAFMIGHILGTNGAKYELLESRDGCDQVLRRAQACSTIGRVWSNGLPTPEKADQ